MSKLQRLITAAGLALMLAIGLGATAPALAACNSSTPSLSSGIDCATSNSASSKPLFGGGSLFVSVVNVLLFIVGAVAIIMIIVGALRYVLSAGNASAVEGAKNTILFAVIGVVVASLAFAIINFVLVRIK